MPGRKPRKAVIVVVGAAGAIGRALVRVIGGESNVVAVDLRTPKSLPGAALCTCADVRDESSIRAARDLVYRQFGRTDGLVYAAGVLEPGGLLSRGVRGWSDAFDVNVFGAVRCVRAFGELMVRQRSGRMVMVGSLGARRGLPGAGAYAASKAALESLVKTAALELAPQGVSVISVSPGFLEGGLSREAKTMVGRIPLGRPGSPREVAEVVRVILSLQTRYLTGVDVRIDGGLGAC